MIVRSWSNLANQVDHYWLGPIYLINCPCNIYKGTCSLTGMTILHPTDEDNINDEGIIHDEVIRSNEESRHH